MHMCNFQLNSCIYLQYKPRNVGSVELLLGSPTEEVPSVEEGAVVEMIIDTEESTDVESSTTGEKHMELSLIHVVELNTKSLDMVELNPTASV